MDTTIGQINGLWYVVKSQVVLGITLWTPISQGFVTSLEARTAQAKILFGKV